MDRHSEELAVMVRDRDALQKHCNNLTRRQVQFQHEIRRKELQYEWLQEKLRNYLAERRRDFTASMEIVGMLRQQAPQQQKDKNKIASKIDDMMVCLSSLRDHLGDTCCVCVAWSQWKSEEISQSRPEA